MGEIRMGSCVVAAALALGACGSGGGAGEAGALPVATTALGAKPRPPAPVADIDTGDPFGVTCTGGGGGTVAVDIEGFTFGPRQAELAAGGSLTFTNLDATDHSVWSVERRDGAPAWLSAGSDPELRLPEVLHRGDASTCTFAAPGTYRYLCGVHNSMTGSVTVS